MSKKDLVKKQDSEVSTEVHQDWGQADVSSKDIMISKILPMQGMSKLVLDRKAAIGEYRDSVTGELLGTIDKPMEFIPFHVEKLWKVQKKVQGKFKYQGMEPITPANESRTWEMTIDGEEFRFDWTYMYYVLRPQDIAAGMPTPYILSFSRTSVKAGKKLYTQMFVKNKQAKLSPAGVVINLLGKIQSNDLGTYIVTDTETNRKSTVEETNAAYEFFQLVKKGVAKADNSDDEVVVETPVTNNSRHHAREDLEF